MHKSVRVYWKVADRRQPGMAGAEPTWMYSRRVRYFPIRAGALLESSAPTPHGRARSVSATFQYLRALYSITSH
jgi:hypothetical protein